MSGFEQLVCERGPRSGTTIAIAVHSTRLGPALGGARMWHYASDDAAVGDAMRLAEAMTLKAAVAGLELGGGKGVIATPSPEPPTGELRRAMLEDFGDVVENLEGAYITAEDVGTDPADMEVIAGRTSHVVGRDPAAGGSGDPSPVTALGVLGAMRACAKALEPARDLAGLRVCVIGLGHVGGDLMRRLASEGAELLAADVDLAKRGFAEALGAEWLSPEEAIVAECDLLAPCALGGAITAELLPQLRTGIICGAANNVLAERSLGAELARAGVLYAPDFVANAGGLISVYCELRSLPHSRALELAAGIERAMGDLLEISTRERITTLEAAERLAASRLASGGSGSVGAGVPADLALLKDC